MTRKPIREKRWMILSETTGLGGIAYFERSRANELRFKGTRVIEVEICEVVKKRKARKR